MFIRTRLLLLSLLVATVAVIVSCSNDEIKFEERALNVSLDFDTSCFEEIPYFFELYFKERVSNAQVHRSFSCINEAMDYVQLRVKGQNKEQYSAEEIQTFLNQFLFKKEEKKISFFKGLLRLKKDIVGGNENYVTFEELQNIKSLASNAEKVFIELRPFAKELTFSESFKDVTTKDRSVQRILSFLEEVMRFHETPLSYESLSFVFKDVVGWDKKWSENLLKVFNIIQGKKLNNRNWQQRDYPVLFESLKRYYTMSLSLSDSATRSWSLKREDFADFYQDVEQALLNIDWSLRQTKQQRWSEEEVASLLHVFNDSEALFSKLSSETLIHTGRVIFGKYFHTTGSADLEINSLKLFKIHRALKKFKAFIEESEDVEGHVGKTFPYKSESDSLFGKYTRSKWPTLYNENNHFVLKTEALEQTFTFSTLFHSAWQFVLGDLMVHAYSENGMSIDELKRAYLDIFELLLELDILSENSRGGWFRIFNEGNLLVPSAQPNGHVSVSEAAEYFSFMFSAYFAGEQTFQRLSQDCPEYQKDCVFYQFTKPGKEVFFTLPELNVFLSNNTSIESFHNWSDSFEYIAKLEINEEPFTEGMFFRGLVGLQYVEVLFRKYDEDKSQTFSFQEAERAFEDFKFALKLLPQIKGSAAENNDRLLRAFFTYFVENGELPKLVNGRPSGKFIRYFARCGLITTNGCNFESDRSAVMAILAYLTSI